MAFSLISRLAAVCLLLTAPLVGQAVLAMPDSPAAGAAANMRFAWTQDRSSQELHTPKRFYTVVFSPDATADLPSGAVVTRVYAARDYSGSANVSSQLCWGKEHDRARCIPLPGRHINTDAFAGLDARGPFLLVHELLSLGRDREPVFVRGTVTVWYTPLPPTE